MAYTDDWETLMNGVFGPGGRFKAAPGTPAEPRQQPNSTLNDLNAALLEQQKKLDAISEKRSSLNPDLVYLDAFAPETQPEMWNEQLFRSLYVYMNTGGILTTYCAKGVIRRMLQAVGFRVERLPGPPGGKREILRATKEKP